MVKKLLCIVILSFMLVGVFTSCDIINMYTNNTPHYHSFGEWQTLYEPTCTTDGKKAKYCECGETQTESIYGSHQYVWVTIKEPTCSEFGSKEATCTVCNNKKTETLYYRGHEADSTGNCSRCGITALKMTSDEMAACLEVHTMHRYVSETSSKIEIWIDFKDNNDYAVQAPAYVEVTIMDEDGNLLYSETLIKKSYQDKVTIDYSEVTPSYTEKGVVYFTVYTNWFYFKKWGEELEHIPLR